MSTISVDHICPRYAGATAMDTITLGSGTPLSKYNRVTFDSAVTGPFSDSGDSTSHMQGVITLMGEDVSLYIYPYTFTPTTSESDTAPLILTTRIPAIYLPDNMVKADRISNVILGSTAAADWQLVSISVSRDGDVAFIPSYPITVGGFCTNDGDVHLPGCTISWSIGQTP